VSELLLLLIYLATVAGAIFIGYRAGKSRGMNIGHTIGFVEGHKQGEWTATVRRELCDGRPTRRAEHSAVHTGPSAVDD
jgi:hypothetical protein